jgi:hypothetical protein
MASHPAAGHVAEHAHGDSRSDLLHLVDAALADLDRPNKVDLADLKQKLGQMRDALRQPAVAALASTFNVAQALAACELDGETRKNLELDEAKAPKARDAASAFAAAVTTREGAEEEEEDEEDEEEEEEEDEGGGNENGEAKHSPRGLSPLAADMVRRLNADKSKLERTPDVWLAPCESALNTMLREGNLGPVTPLPKLITQGHANDCDSWDFDVFALSCNELAAHVARIFYCHGLFGLFSVSRETFADFVLEVRANYLSNPYHSWVHGVDVLQTMHAFLLAGAADLMEPEERLASLIAALCHDLRHPGLNNAYQIAARTPLAVLYNDTSVLEHHHCASTFRILSQPRTNLLARLSEKHYRAVRATMISAILSTDMTCHFHLVDKFKEFVDSRTAAVATEAPSQGKEARSDTVVRHAADAPPAAPAPPRALSAPERELLVKVLVHTSDISNPCKSWRLSKTWSDLIADEFFLQGDLERAQGMAVSQNMDRFTTDRAQLGANFIDFIVAPLMVAVRRLLPNVAFGCDNMRLNRANWQALVEEAIAASARPNVEKAQERSKWARRLEAFQRIVQDGK